MIVYGRKPVREALWGRRSGQVRDVWAIERLAGESWVHEGGTRVHVAAARDIEERCGSPDHQGVCAECGSYPYAGPDELLRGPDPFVLVLDQIQDPQNLGAICRTAECVGVSGVAIPERRAAEVTPAVCKASAGAVEYLRLARVRNVADFLGDAKRAGCWCYGASAQAAVAYDRPDYRGGAVLVLGGEGKGLRPRVAAACDEMIALPMHGRIGSLNVSAAAAALLYEALQRRAPLDSAS